MSYYPMSDWKLSGFVKSNAKNKKYTAIIRSGNKIKKIHFGDSRYEQYKDSSGLGLYSKLDHGDKKRRASYKSRHSGFLKPGFYSAGYFSMNYLW
jgi:hypothetical protein